jgi:hypothetical protein
MVVGGEARGKEAIGRPRRRWEDNIKMDLKKIGVGCGAQDRDKWRALVSTVKNLRVQKNVGNFLTSCKDWLASQEGLCSME